MPVPVVRSLLLVLLLLLLPRGGAAQGGVESTPLDSLIAPSVEAPDSPRASMRQFLELARQEDYARAARFLVLDRRNAAARGPELAMRVHRFIERRVVIDLDSISPLSRGNPADGEPPLTDRVGRMYEGGTMVRPIVLVRRTVGGETRWLIADETVALADTSYAALDTSWTAGRLPRSLRDAGPFGIPRWKWLFGLLAPAAVWVATLLVASVLRRGALLVARRTRSTWDDRLVELLRGPVRLFIAAVLASAIPLVLELDAAAAVAVWRALRALSLVAVFWALLRATDLVQEQLGHRAWMADSTTARTVVPLVGRSLKVLIGLVAVLVVISNFGYPVGTVLAGLGLGGLAVALAAQKTVENLFGSVSLAGDRVFRVGDWVKVEDVQGSVERIGLRSTHLRTPDRTVVKIPNGKLADMRVESFGERDRIRFNTTLSLVLTTTAAQLRAVLAEVDRLLRTHPRIWPDGISVRFVAIGQYGLDVAINAWFATTDFPEFEGIRQEVLLGILDAVERAGTALALPTQVVRVDQNGRATGAVVRTDAS